MVGRGRSHRRLVADEPSTAKRSVLYREHRACRLRSSAGHVHFACWDSLADAGLVKALPDPRRSRFPAALALAAGQSGAHPFALFRLFSRPLAAGVYGNVFFLLGRGAPPAEIDTDPIPRSSCLIRAIIVPVFPAFRTGRQASAVY